jgi:hypothetical protein
MMFTKYYLVIRPQTDEYHALHKEGCPFLADHDKSIYLGKFKTSLEALREGQILFNRTKSCRFCLKEHHTEKREPVFAETVLTGPEPAGNQIFLSREVILSCFLN